MNSPRESLCMHKKSFSGCLCTGQPIFMLSATVRNQFLKWTQGKTLCGFFCALYKCQKCWLLFQEIVKGLKGQRCKCSVCRVTPGRERNTHSFPSLSKIGVYEQSTQANWLLQIKLYLPCSQTAVKHGAAGTYKYTHCDSTYLP